MNCIRMHKDNFLTKDEYYIDIYYNEEDINDILNRCDNFKLLFDDFDGDCTHSIVEPTYDFYVVCYDLIYDYEYCKSKGTDKCDDCNEAHSVITNIENIVGELPCIIYSDGLRCYHGLFRYGEKI